MISIELGSDILDFTTASAGPVKDCLKSHIAVPLKILHASDGDFKADRKAMILMRFLSENVQSFIWTEIFLVM